MMKLIAAINMTVDGICDHTVVNPDEEIHKHYTDLLSNAENILYGRRTYQLMQFWQDLVKNPSGEKSMDEFAIAIDRIPKIVFSRTLKNTEWESARLANQDLEDEVLKLKQSHYNRNKKILVGSPGLIVTLTKLGLIDEYQFCIHPVIAGSGMLLFKNITERVELNLLTTKTFDCGAVIFYYQPVK